MMAAMTKRLLPTTRRLFLPVTLSGRLPTTLLTILLAVAACRPSSAPEAPAPEEGPELARTATRPIADVRRRTIGFADSGVWISNELEGGRVSDAWRGADSVYVIEVRPENAPVNNSAWYAFKVWADAPRTIDLRLVYHDGSHRYWPKVRRAGEPWTPVDSASVRSDATGGSTTLRLRVGPDTVWVAGQEVLTTAFFDRWTDSLAAAPGVSRRVIATSPRGRPIRMLELGDPAADRHVVVISRQHPPEVSGTFALLRFVEELAGDSELAREFRRRFRIHVFPVVNPDGVDLGHWRHNTGGVDLNRDWGAFLQPETRAVRDEVLRILEQPGAELWFGVDFHSTHHDVFYTLDRELETTPAAVIDPWLRHIDDALPHYDVNDSASGLSLPTSRNWFYARFGAPALIYEVGDETPRPLIREVAATAARATMEVLMERAAAARPASSDRPASSRALPRPLPDPAGTPPAHPGRPGW